MQLRTAVIVVDMVADYFRPGGELPVTPYARAIVPVINRLTGSARAAGLPVVYACDSFLEGDFIFGGRMAPHALRGTPGAEPVDLLERGEGDIVLPKRRFSAFFKTDLDQTLRTLGVQGVAVCGITTHVCVLATVLDAVCHDLHTFLVSDACASHKPEVHEATLSLYRNNPLEPLLRVMTAEEYLGEFVR